LVRGLAEHHSFKKISDLFVDIETALIETSPKTKIRN